ncbi:HupE/UreJ family protein [Sphingomonas sp. G124]|uniref:HupE/UreJ family protein n=1 Tax=Sphingomonas cremea TaxID=2904799 RepID=A0A9X1QLD6_9SPHN|nr:HupE/UreJ family protein [Sphingomonas cremea]MCF2513499.1 HupE/UreJ family protein [Sphingomonas cremea]
MNRLWLRLALWLGLLMAATAVQAHESRPAYLEINEVVPGRYSLLWRTPTNGGMPLPVRLQLPAGVRDLTPTAVRELSDSRVERRLIESPDGLAGKRIYFVGLQGTIADVLVRVQQANGIQSTVLVHPSNAWVDIPREQGAMAVASSYGLLGVEHILSGFDHLCFVLALIMIVGFNRRLFWTVTAFTLAHSITLALATLGVIHVPGPPVEATIALSIVFVASEIIQQQRGREGLASKQPWLVAFTFGLLHGLGFAGALAEIGLPPNAIPLALLFFNIGVEVGQLMFIAAVYAAMRLLFALVPERIDLRRAAAVPAVMIGGLASFWVIERVYNFWV